MRLTPFAFQLAKSVRVGREPDLLCEFHIAVAINEELHGVFTFFDPGLNVPVQIQLEAGDGIIMCAEVDGLSHVEFGVELITP